MTNDERAYRAVKAAKQAVLNGEQKPEGFPQDCWEVLVDMYDKKSR